jgi:hypothetical protein
MWRRVAISILPAISFLQLWGQAGGTSGCLPNSEFAPTLVRNPDGRVTFKCDHATAFDLIRAVGFQARIPMGIVLGQDLTALTKTARPYDLVNADARSVLLKAIEGTTYSIQDQNHVVLILAGDLTRREKDLLIHRYSKFATGLPSNKMVCLGMVLNGWMGEAVHPGAGFGGSCATSTNEEQLKLTFAPVATTEEIANQIVSQGSKGMWIFKESVTNMRDEPKEEIDIVPYQHYSNRAIDQQRMGNPTVRHKEISFSLTA